LESQENQVVTSAKYKTYTDSELVSLCLKGDSNAWEALITRYRRLIYSIPVRFSFSTADASDVFQSVCLKLIEHLHELKDETKVSAWLITTTTRQCIHVRSQKFREGGSEEDLEEPPDPSENLEDLRVQIEEQQQVREAVEQLADRCRQLVDLLYFDTRSPTYEDVSQILGMPVASIGPTRARCLDKLKTILRRRGIK
jgi:RNA polymerase sigma factor (sigma-70 family)